MVTEMSNSHVLAQVFGDYNIIALGREPRVGILFPKGKDFRGEREGAGG
jgi:hypothetical protein